MSDHIDGPRQIGDPSIDLTDLFAFTSPENPGSYGARADVFPSAGASAMFSNVAQSLDRGSPGDCGRPWAMPRSSRRAIRNIASAADLTRSSPGPTAQSRSSVALAPFLMARRSEFVVNDEKGASTPDGAFRVFAGLALRSLLSRLADGTPEGNSRICCSTTMCSASSSNSIRTACSTPAKARCSGPSPRQPRFPRPEVLSDHEPPRFDWVGRPEQTNMRLNNPILKGADDVRDLWNQQTPFAIADESPPAVPQAPDRQSGGVGHARRQGRLDACGARRQRRGLSRRFLAVRRVEADHRHQPSRDREKHAQRDLTIRQAEAAPSMRTTSTSCSPG